jgi:hypothetical protein
MTDEQQKEDIQRSVYGFVSVPGGLLLGLIDHPFFSASEESDNWVWLRLCIRARSIPDFTMHWVHFI